MASADLPETLESYLLYSFCPFSAMPASSTRLRPFQSNKNVLERRHANTVSILIHLFKSNYVLLQYWIPGIIYAKATRQQI